MQVIDYYAMLEVPPGATQLQIKRAFRKLAQLHHPDKQPGNPEASAYYQQLHTAYKTLTTPELREVYLQERWLHQANGLKFGKQKILSVDAILNDAKQIADHSLNLNRFQFDYVNWYCNVADVINAPQAEHLQLYATPAEINIVITYLITAGDPLPFSFQQKLLRLVKERLLPATATSAKLDEQLKTWKRRHSWKSQQVWLIILLTLLTCLAIFFAG